MDGKCAYFLMWQVAVTVMACPCLTWDSKCTKRQWEARLDEDTPVLVYSPWSKTEMPSCQWSANLYFSWCHRCPLADAAEATETKGPVAQNTARARGYYGSTTK